MPFEAAQARKDSCISCLSKSAPTTILWKCKLFVNADSFVATFVVRSVSISRTCRIKKIQNRTAHDRSYDRMIHSNDVSSEPFLTNLNWLFSKLTQVQRRAKYCHLSKPRHIHVQVARSASARATPQEQWKSNLSESSSLAWVIAKRES